jgi:hypothetical protein
MQDEKFEEDGTRKSEPFEAETDQQDEAASNKAQANKDATDSDSKIADSKDSDSDQSKLKDSQGSSAAGRSAENAGDSSGGGKIADASTPQEIQERRICWDAARLHIVEVLSFAVQHHGHRFKYYVMRHPAVPKVLKLVRHKDKYLALAAIRFLRYVCVHMFMCVRYYFCACMCVCMLPKVLKLVRHKNKYLALAAIRFLRYVCVHSVHIFLCVKYVRCNFWCMCTLLKILKSLYVCMCVCMDAQVAEGKYLCAVCTLLKILKSLYLCMYVCVYGCPSGIRASVLHWPRSCFPGMHIECMCICQ